MLQSRSCFLFCLVWFCCFLRSHFATGHLREGQGEACEQHCQREGVLAYTSVGFWCQVATWEDPASLQNHRVWLGYLYSTDKLLKHSITVRRQLSCDDCDVRWAGELVHSGVHCVQADIREELTALGNHSPACWHENLHSPSLIGQDTKLHWPHYSCDK